MNTRTKSLNDIKPTTGSCVIYCMSRDQRVHSNFALLAAQEDAIQYKLPLLDIFNLVPKLTPRLYEQYEFMIDGLKEVDHSLHMLHIPFLVLEGNPRESLLQAIHHYKPRSVYFDFSPLRNARTLHSFIAGKISASCYEVDTHNIIPVWTTSDKEEWAAYTIRPKIHRLLPHYLKAAPPVKKHPFSLRTSISNHWEAALKKVKAPSERRYKPLLKSGAKEAQKVLKTFIDNHLSSYSAHRNDPTKHVLSNMSPYLHFGQISSLDVALAVHSHAHAAAFLEELIVRKELSDNYCYYNPHYDSIKGARDWAIKTLEKHKKDPRPYLLSRDQLEEAQSHDAAWNAAQQQLVRTGKIHGYMRMYWAKKVLEWSTSAETAIEHTIYLNDKYHLDGYDPNGYVGILWSIAGVHDRPWFERPIYGQIRYMSLKGLQQKFQLDEYIQQWQ